MRAMKSISASVPFSAAVLGMASVILFAGQLKQARGDTIYQSATASPVSEWRGGPELVDWQFVGVRFQVTSTVTTGRIGGIFQNNYNPDPVGAPGSVFGAIVALDSPTDFPNSSDLLTPDVLSVSLIPTLKVWPPPESSAEVSVTLVPGWYAMVFGAGRFGATPQGNAVAGQYDVDSPSYFWRHVSGTYYNGLGGSSGVRMFLEDQSQDVPEPSCMLGLWSASAALAIGLIWRRRGWKDRSIRCAR